MTSGSSIPDNSSAAPVFVTGAAGHVGANLVRRLLDEDTRVRVLLRHEENNEALEGLEVERVFGDLRDLNSVRRAVEGCQGVYHCAAKVSTIEGNHAHRREIYECNVLGTRNMLQAARETEAGRVVVTGSFSAVGYNLDDPSAPSDETMLFYPMERTMPYERSKTLVEQVCWRAAAAGQDVIVATCCAVVGGSDFFPSRLGRTLCDYTNGKLHAYVDGGFEFVAARDIVEGHRLCMDRGRSGEKYIFSSEYKTISDIIDLYEEVSGIPRPTPADSSPYDARFRGSRKFLSEPVSSKFPSAFHSQAPFACCKSAVTPTPTRRKRNLATSRPASAPRFTKPTPFTTTSARRSRTRTRNPRARMARDK